MHKSYGNQGSIHNIKKNGDCLLGITYLIFNKELLNIYLTRIVPQDEIKKNKSTAQTCHSHWEFNYNPLLGNISTLNVEITTSSLKYYFWKTTQVNHYVKQRRQNQA